MMWHSTFRRFVVLGGGVLCLTAFGVLAQEQSFFAGGPAVELTAAQANRGTAVYDANGANCKGSSLDYGQFGPPLRGSAFRTHWSSQSADALFSYISARMPPSAPSGLS